MYDDQCLTYPVHHLSELWGAFILVVIMMGAFIAVVIMMGAFILVVMMMGASCVCVLVLVVIVTGCSWSLTLPRVGQ